MSENPKMKIIGGTDKLGDEELRQWLEQHVEKLKNVAIESDEEPTSVMAILQRKDHIGYSKTALESYLLGTYFLSKEQNGFGVQAKKIEKAVRAYRDRTDGTFRDGYDSHFLKTRTWNQVQHAFKTAITEKAIVLVYGEPGIGKSRCLQEYKVTKLSTMPIVVLCSANITARYFVQKIAREVGVSDHFSTAALEDKIIEKARANNRVLIVDQGNYLPVKGLGTICYFWENTGTPTVLFGTQDLHDTFWSSDLTEDVRRQLSSRIRMQYPLFKLDVSELKAIVGRTLPQLDDKALAHIFNITGGNFRHLGFLLPEIKHHISLQNGNISDMPSLITNAAKRLFVG
jgi:DNA transposition AAA+ family ATPase